MARTLNAHRRRKHGASAKVTPCTYKRHNDTLRQWMEPYEKKEKSQASPMIIIESSDDESTNLALPESLDTVLSMRDERRNSTKVNAGSIAGSTMATAIEIGDSCSTGGDSMESTEQEGAFEEFKRKKTQSSNHSSSDPRIEDLSYNEDEEAPRTCAAITRKGTQCTFLVIKGETLCSRHVNLYKKDAPSQGKERKSYSPHDDEEGKQPIDTLYLGKKGHYRCIAVTRRGRLCSYKSVNDTVYCFCHAELSQFFFQDSSPLKLDGSDSGNGSTAASPTNSEMNTKSESESSDSDSSEEGTVTRPYKFKEFETMWHECEEYFGEMTDEIESTRRVRGANSKMAPGDTDGQLKAQYGRLLPRAMKKLMTEILELSKEDVFLDIGHGIGNTCIQAAFTVGCESRGIEVVYDRNSVAEVFRDNLDSQNKDNPNSRVVGEVFLRHGRLEDELHQDFLTKGVTRAYVNNFNGVFAERSSKGNQKWFLDDYVSGIFASMAPGTIMVTLHPLNLGPTQSEANKSRNKQGLLESEDSSFYEVEKVLLGKACDTVKWNQHSSNKKNIYVYKYTRTIQSSDSDAVFLCCNPTCPIATSQVPIPATTKNEEGRVVINHCECKVTAKNLRRQRRKVYVDH